MLNIFYANSQLTHKTLENDEKSFECLYVNSDTEYVNMYFNLIYLWGKKT